MGEPDTVYVTRPALPAEKVEVTKAVLPPDCRRALDMAVTIRDEAGKMDTASAPQADLMSRAQVAIAAQDLLKLNELATQQRQLRNDTLDTATTLQSDLYVYQQVLNQCIQEVPK
jgi:hypothetical protein